MKKIYKLVLSILIMEYLCVMIMNERDIHIYSWIGNVLGALVVLVPILILLYFIGRDETISNKYRIVARFIFKFSIFCYITGAIVKAITM